MYFNQVSIVVTLGKDADVKAVGERNLVSFTGASSKTWTDGSGVQRDSTSWVNFKYWCKSAKIASYLVKGTTLLVSGEIATDTWEKDGAKHSATYVNVTNIQFVSKRDGRSSDNGSSSPAGGGMSSGDVPF